MPSDEFGGRVNNNISSVLERLYQIWCRQCIVDDQWYSVLMDNISSGANIQGVKTWIADGFSKHSFGSIIERGPEVFRVSTIHEANSDPKPGESIVKEIIRSTIKTGRGDDFVA